MKTSPLPWRDVATSAGLALVLRIVAVFWGAGRVPPSADGAFYHVVAGRIAEGHGYSWLWPDGVVTPAAHYPIGYPALIGAGYALFGAHPVVAMCINALLGALGVGAAHALGFFTAAESAWSAFARRAAFILALALAVSPTLVAYTPALMTESAVGTLLVAAVLAVFLVSRAPREEGALRFVVLALAVLLLIAATLVRPQSLVFAPALGWAAFPSSFKARAVGALLLTSTTVLGCLPWTLRNCEQMERCVFVSANGGWNLLIGTFPEARGAWVPLENERVPVECREVFQEAAKDACFGAAGKRRVLDAPGPWLALVPAKLRVTFDHTASAAEHLGAAGALPEAAKWGLGALEILWQRLEYLLAVLGVVALGERERRALRSWRPTSLVLVAVLGLGFFAPTAYLSLVGLVLYGVVRVRRLSAPVLLALFSIGATAAIHAVFFGAGRYSMPLLLLVAPAAALGAAVLSGGFRRADETASAENF